MPAIGREIGISDFWVAVAYTWSAVLWVLLAPYWAEKSDHHGRKALTLLGLTGFIVSTLLCGIVLHLGLEGMIGGAVTFALVRNFSCDLRLASVARRRRRRRPIWRRRRVEADAWPRFPRSLRPSDSARSSARPSPLCSCCRSSVLPVLSSPSRQSHWRSSLSILLWLPNDRYGRRIGRGAAMSYPSIASQPTGASVVAATSPRRKRLSWRDARSAPGFSPEWLRDMRKRRRSLASASS